MLSRKEGGEPPSSSHEATSVSLPAMDANAQRGKNMNCPTWLRVNARFRPWGLLGLYYFLPLTLFLGLTAIRKGALGLRHVSTCPTHPLDGGLAMLACNAVVLLVLYLFDRSSFMPKGLALPLARWLFAGLAGGVAFQLLNVSSIRAWFPLWPKCAALFHDSLGSASVPSWLLPIVAAGIVTPVIEEIFFRGALQESFTRYYGPTTAIFLTALSFSLMHWAPGALQQSVLSFFFGILASAVRLRQKNLSFPLGLHMGINLMAALDVILTGVR